MGTLSGQTQLPPPHTAAPAEWHRLGATVNTGDEETRTPKDGEVIHFFSVPSVGAPNCALMVVVP